jgi:hypothetical protein
VGEKSQIGGFRPGIEMLGLTKFLGSTTFAISSVYPMTLDPKYTSSLNTRAVEVARIAGSSESAKRFLEERGSKSRPLFLRPG